MAPHSFIAHSLTLLRKDYRKNQTKQMQRILISEAKIKVDPDGPATDKNSADTQDHWSYSVEQFETPIVNGDLVRSNHSRDDPGEGTDKYIGHVVTCYDDIISCPTLFTN